MMAKLNLGPSEVIQALESAGRLLKPKQLAHALGVPESQYRRFRDLLRSMEGEGKVYCQRKGRYGVPRDLNLVVGVLQTTRQGDGFVVREAPGEMDVFVRHRNLGSAVDGDRVVVRVEKHRPGRNPEGRLVKVLERAWSQVVGIYVARKGYGVVHPREPALKVEVFIPPDFANEATQGVLVVAEIDDWGEAEASPVGRVVRILGAPEDPGVDVLSIILGHQLPLEFPAGAEKEAETIARRGIRPEDLIQREDFRNELVFTIDPPDAQDHDDALSVRLEPDGSLTVGVHIADVSFYVKPGSEIDREARERGTSVYLVDRVVPMLPHALSSGLCSLRPDEDRLTLSVVFRFSGDGDLVDSRITRGVVCSRARLSYRDAQSMLDGAAMDGGGDFPEGLAEALHLLAGAGRLLRERRMAAGSIDFDLPESRVVLNEGGQPQAIDRVERLETNRLIEDFMILANETVAQMALSAAVPIIFRVHDAPDEAKLENLRLVAATFGHSLPRGAIKPKHLAALVRRAEGKPQQTLIQTVTLRSMKRALYSTTNVGHFGLASRAYAHFTSPIRRYPDLTVHRQLIRHVAQEPTNQGPVVEALAETARHSSLRERRAVEAERDSVAMKKAEYMLNHLGDDFRGTIAGVTAFGLFVLLDDVHVEGLVRVSSLGDDFYVFEEAQHMLTGRRTHRQFRLGDGVSVQVARVDKEAREIDFELLEGPLDRVSGDG